MQIPQLNQIMVPDKNLTLIQANVNSALQALNTTDKITFTTNSAGKTTSATEQISSPFANGNVITTSLKATQDNLVQHGLGVVPSFWIVIRLFTNATIWEVSTTALATPQISSQSATSQFLNLWTSANAANVSLWIV